MEAVSPGFAIPSIQTVTRLSAASNCHSKHCQVSSATGADSRQLVQSPVGPPSAPTPQKVPGTVGAYWPPIGRTTSELPEPVASTRVKCAQSGAVGKASTRRRIRP